MGYVYRITSPQEPEQIAYALTYLGVHELRNNAERNGRRIHWQKLRLCQVPACELELVKALVR